MTFRKDSISFYTEFCFDCILALLTAVLAPTDPIGVFPYLSILFLIFAVLEFKIRGEFVTINDAGICCNRNGKPVWKYRWDEIIKLKRCSCNRLPCMAIVIDSNSNEVVPYDYSLHYFELGRKARKAVTQYYKQPHSDIS